MISALFSLKRRSGLDMIEVLGDQEAQLDCLESALDMRSCDGRRQAQDVLALLKQDSGPGGAKIDSSLADPAALARARLATLLRPAGTRTRERVKADNARLAAIDARRTALFAQEQDVKRLEAALVLAEDVTATALKRSKTERELNWLRGAPSVPLPSACALSAKPVP